MVRGDVAGLTGLFLDTLLGGVECALFNSGFGVAGLRFISTTFLKDKVRCIVGRAGRSGVSALSRLGNSFGEATFGEVLRVLLGPANSDKFPDKLKRLCICGDGDAGRLSNLWSSRRHFETQLANTRLLTRRNLSGVRGWNFLRLPLGTLLQ